MERRAKLKLISCGMISREMKAAIARSPNKVEVVFLPAALHGEGAATLLDTLQRAVDLANGGFDAVLIGYGLCGNGLNGLRAGGAPLVVPRAHDCITLLMGSRHRYSDYFDSHPGVYFLSTGWMEEGCGARPAGPVPSLGGYTLPALVRKYGEENGRYVYETLQHSVGRYRQFTFIETGQAKDAACAGAAEAEAARRGWAFEKMRGDLSLFEKMVDGAWDAADFIVVPAGKRLVARYDEGIFGVED